MVDENYEGYEDGRRCLWVPLSTPRIVRRYKKHTTNIHGDYSELFGKRGTVSSVGVVAL